MPSCCWLADTKLTLEYVNARICLQNCFLYQKALSANWNDILTISYLQTKQSLCSMCLEAVLCIGFWSSKYVLSSWRTMLCHVTNNVVHVQGNWRTVAWHSLCVEVRFWPRQFLMGWLSLSAVTVGTVGWTRMYQARHACVGRVILCTWKYMDRHWVLWRDLESLHNVDIM